MKKGKFPVILVGILTYITVFSIIPHKEGRFMLPTIPILIIIAGEVIYKFLGKFGRLASKIVWFLVIYELVLMFAFF